MQSVPSRMALATSVDSARVGSRLAVMDSSICVAVITGLPTRTAREMRSFWMMAICSTGISTPRSPRATMMPSLALRMSSRCLSASARSIFAMTKGCLPSAFAAARTASMSAAVSTNDWLTASTPFASANSRQARSCSVNALIPRSMPERLSPFRERSSPPTATLHRTSLPVTRSTTSCTRPSLRNSWSPGFTTLGSRSKLIETRRWSPTMSSVVSVKGSPGSSWIGSGSILPMRIFGPGRSAMIATRRPVACAAARMRAMCSAWPAKSPCEKFNRAMFSPARMRRSSISGDSEAGPIVATILVLC